MDPQIAKNVKMDREGEAELAAQKKNDAMRQHWNRAVCKEFDVPSSYQSVAVLLIHWEDWLDTELKCGEETKELENVFRDQYGFSTRRVVLDCKVKKPQAQLHLATSQFVSDFDGPHQTTLLMIYYSGHGYLQDENENTDRLYISGTMSGVLGNNEFENFHTPSCRWKSVETHLHDATADVLTIMDSCYSAAVINKSITQVARSFETIAAAYVNTHKPGPRSFTRALITSLISLKEETTTKEQPPFDTSRLHGSIMRRMPSTHQMPPLLIRNEKLNARHICLAPLTQTTHPKPLRTERAKGILQLQVIFAKHKELNEEETTRLGTALVSAVKGVDLSITALDWVLFKPSPLSIPITVIVTMSLQAWIRRWRRLQHQLQHTLFENRGREHDRDDDDDDDERPSKRPMLSPPAHLDHPLTPASGDF